MAEAAGQANKLNIFISYSRDDLAFADQLDAALGLTGFSTSIDRHGISAGEDWQKRLGNLIRDADTIVFVLSPSSAKSKTCAWCRGSGSARQAHHSGALSLAQGRHAGTFALTGKDAIPSTQALKSGPTT